ncbi:MAG TPA: hypothetical protein VE782_13785, partial [Myxococcaceae bacterium]|nr:hypothetical protein [Myxococcaceae bacterium]
FFASNPLDYTLPTVPGIFAAHGDVHAGIDEAAGSLDALLELAARQEAEGQPDAPWPPHFSRAEGEAPRVAPSRAKGASRGRRLNLPVITIAQAKLKSEALAGLERWKAKYPQVAARLAPEDVLVDTNRGRATAWYRIRINLKNVPESERPPAETPDPNYDPKSEYGEWLRARDAEHADRQEEGDPDEAT